MTGGNKSLSATIFVYYTVKRNTSDGKIKLL